MAIPISAIIQLLLDRFIFHPAAMEPEVSAGRDLASCLRYKAQELVQGMRTQARVKKMGKDQWVKQTDKVLNERTATCTGDQQHGAASLFDRKSRTCSAYGFVDSRPSDETYDPFQSPQPVAAEVDSPGIIKPPGKKP